MHCPYCNFRFRLLATAGSGGSLDVQKCYPLLCEDCTRISILYDGKVHPVTNEQLEVIKQSPAYIDVLKPCIDEIVRQRSLATKTVN